ncbi:3D domain-containing protein [Verrucomicrobiota bacterium sgz303538]
MKPILLLPLIIALLFSACATHPTAGTGALRKGTTMKVRTTAYTHTEAGGRKNAIGGRLRFGGDTYSAAADWSWMPLGTRFKIVENGRTYVIEDYGSALVGRKTIDLYMPNRRTMNAWGVRHVDIEILEWGSRIMSLKLLEGRQRNSHVRTMVAALRMSKSGPRFAKLKTE